MLLAPEALVVVALALEQLTKVRFAVEFTVEGGKGAQAAETTGWKKKGDQSKSAGKRGGGGRERKSGLLT